mgnify:CR=1 FL=1
MTNEDNQEHGGWPRRRWSRGARIRFAAAAIVLVPLLLVLFAAITMWLWNWLMPVIFNLPEITIWQAAGLVVLSRILFRGGGFGGGHGRRHWKRMRIRERMQQDAAS